MSPPLSGRVIQVIGGGCSRVIFVLSSSLHNQRSTLAPEIGNLNGVRVEGQMSLGEVNGDAALDGVEEGVEGHAPIEDGVEVSHRRNHSLGRGRSTRA